MARLLKDQVVADIERFHRDGCLPRAWDVKDVNKHTQADYWAWVYANNGGKEPQSLCLDEIPSYEREEFYQSSKFKAVASAWIRENGPEIFTVREMLVYSLCFVDGLHERVAGERIGVSQPRVCQLKQAIVKKLRKVLVPLLSNG